MNSNIGLDSIVKRSSDFVSCDIDGETALMSVENGRYYGLDPIGSRIWILLQEARPVLALCDLLLEEFDVEPAQCSADTLNFLNDLALENLLEVLNGATG